MSNLLRGGASGGGGGSPSSGAANPASVGSLRSLSHLNSLRRGMAMPVGGNSGSRMTKSRSFANLSGKGDWLYRMFWFLLFFSTLVDLESQTLLFIRWGCVGDDLTFLMNEINLRLVSLRYLVMVLTLDILIKGSFSFFHFLGKPKKISYIFPSRKCS